METPSVEELRDLCENKTVFLVGSGPSLDKFPVAELSGKITICLNDSLSVVSPSFWLFGDPRFARWKASKILRGRTDPLPDRLVMNKKHLRYLARVPEERLPNIYWFTNDHRHAENAEEKHSFWWSYRGLLPGRWTIATIGLSLAVKLGASRVVLVGIDMGRVDGSFYSQQVDSKAPGRQESLMGQWRKWIQQGFKRNLWPIQVVTTSKSFNENCPGTPVKLVELDEVFNA